MSSRIIKLGILDDHQLFRSGICELIKDYEGFDVVISVATRDELFTQLKSNTIDILLLDIRLKETTGEKVLQEIKTTYPSIKVIMLTMHCEKSYLVRMVQKGADGYLVKDSEPEELVKTLKNVYTYGRYFNTTATSNIILGMREEEEKIKNGSYLKEHEIQLLKYLSKGNTAEEIGKAMFKSPRTIEGYKQRILEKTETKNTAELISWGYNNGYL